MLQKYCSIAGGWSTNKRKTNTYRYIRKSMMNKGEIYYDASKRNKNNKP